MINFINSFFIEFIDFKNILQIIIQLTKIIIIQYKIKCKNQDKFLIAFLNMVQTFMIHQFF